MLNSIQCVYILRTGGFLCVSVLLFFGPSIGMGSANAQSSDTAICPAGFNQTTEDDTSISCLFSQMLSTSPDQGVLPQDTAEGQSLLKKANTYCLSDPTNGQVTDVGGEGTDSVYLICVVDKLEPPAPQPPAPQPPAPQPPVSETFDFDSVIELLQEPITQEVANSVVNFCNRLLEDGAPNQTEADVLQVCRNIDGEADVAAQLNALKLIAPKQLVQIGKLIRFPSSVQVGDIGNRLAALQSLMAQNTRDVAISDSVHPSRGLLGKASSLKGGAAGDTNTALDRFGVFVTGSYGYGEKDNTELSHGFDYSSSVFTLGIDYLVDDSAIVGLAFGSASSETSFSDRTGSIDVHTDNINLYGLKRFGKGWFADAIIGFGKIDMQNERFITFNTNGVEVDQLASSQVDSDQTLVSLGFGKGISRVVDIDLAARLNYMDTSIERFSETTDQDSAGFGLAIEMEAYDLKSFTSDLSASISKPFSRLWGVIVPKLTMRWIHEFERGDDNMSGRFLADVSSFDFTQSSIELSSGPSGSTIFRVPLERIDSNYGTLLVGVTALLPNQVSLHAAYSRTVELSDFDHSYYSVKLRKDF